MKVRSLKVVVERMSFETRWRKRKSCGLVKLTEMFRKDVEEAE